MSANSQGIQALFEAEKEAAKIVEQARKYRVQKLKDARQEAAKEVQAFQQAKALEVEQVQLSKEDLDALEHQMQRETDVKIETIEHSYAQNKAAAIDLILKATTQF
ncbi:putative V-type proton ATPase subunit G [Smittium mucronatum]|uniref:V-type proton ATPase subunit G n=1 Tax=Smittium mucronatum TaxID=133383 RepID=A0A1R0H4F5_9FUNG|nr:putative V-type proton ATPase subunit G [Smittium mucronatum]